MAWKQKWRIFLALTGALLVLSGCSSFKRCASGAGDALTSGDPVTTVLGVIFIPLVPICTGVQAFASMDKEDRQALVDTTQTVAVIQQQQQQATYERNAELARINERTTQQEAQNRAYQEHLRSQEQQAAQRQPKPNWQMSAGMGKTQATSESAASPNPSIGVGSVSDVRDTQQIGNHSRYTSNDATSCVEPIQGGFKSCSTYSKQCLMNICPYKISVRYRGTSAWQGWGQIDLGPQKSTPAPPRAGETLEWTACSWDPQAGPGNGPLMGPPCHY